MPSRINISGFLRRCAGVVLAGAVIIGAPGAGFAAPTEKGREGFYESGLGYFDQKDFKAAIIQLRNALQQNPTHIAARVLLGRAYVEIGDGAQAELELNIAEKNGATEDAVAPLLGRAYLLQGKYKDVLDRFPVHLIKGARAARIFVVRGDAYLGLKQLENARKSFEEAIARQPEDAEPYLGLSHYQFALGEYEKALEFAEAATSRRFFYPQAWYLTGEIHRHLAVYDQAISAYRQTLEQAPEHKAARLGVATSLIELGQLKKALKEVDAIKGRDKFDPWPHYLLSVIHGRLGNRAESQVALTDAGAIVETAGSALGIESESSLLISALVLVAQNKLSQAETFFGRYFEIAPLNVSVRKLHARVLLGQNKAEAALATLAAVAEPAKGDVLYHVLRGTALVGAKQFSAAAKAFEAALKLDPDHPELQAQIAMGKLITGDRGGATKALVALAAGKNRSQRAGMLLGMIYLNSRDFAKAEEVARGILAKQPDNGVAIDIAGVSLIRRNRLEEAKKIYTAAMALGPDYDPLLFRIGEIERLRGNLVEAGKAFQTILDRSPGNARALYNLAIIADLAGEPDKTVAFLNEMQAGESRDLLSELRLINLIIVRRIPAAVSAATSLSKRFPRDFRAQQTLARALISSGKISAARPVLAQATRLIVANRRARGKNLIRIAYLQQKANDLAGARRTLSLAVKANARNVTAFEALHSLELQSRRFEQAESLIGVFEASNIGSPFAAMLRGDLAYARQNFAESVKQYRIALKGAKTPALMKRLHTALRRLEGDDAALTALAGWLKEFPRDAVAQRTYALGLMEAGRTDEAIAYHRALLRAAPTDAGLLNNLAILLKRKSDPEALAVARRAVDLAPAEPAMLDTYGWLLVQAGRAREGIRYLQQAKRILVADPRIDYHYAAALAAEGENKRALDQIKRVLENHKKFEGVDGAIALMSRLSAEIGQSP